MKIGEREIGPGHPVFLQVEAGVTTMGNVRRTCEMIDAAAAAGMDAFKMIVTDPLKVESRPNRLFSYEQWHPAENFTEQVTPYVTEHRRPIGDLLAETVFSYDDWKILRDYCHSRGLIFYATADHLDAVDMLESLGVPAHKLCAWDIAFYPLLEAMRKTGKPILVDVGTATREEVIAAIPDSRQVIFVHSPHPLAGRNWNMNRLTRFFEPDIAYGFSSPGREDWCDFMALGGGASLIEKRLTLNRTEPLGHHHAISLEPDELKVWARAMRMADQARLEDPFAGTEEAWEERRRNDRMPNGLRP